MLIYERNDKDKSIDIYTMEVRKEKMKKFKKKVLKYIDEPLFYHLKTNDDSVLNRIASLDVKNDFLNYSNHNTWSQLALMEKIKEEDIKRQEEILNKYINGDYDSLIPSRIYDKDGDICRLLKIEDIEVLGSNNKGSICEIKNMLNLPRKLYFLQLLLTGYFDRLVDEDIKEELELFKYGHFKNVCIRDIEEILATKLVEGSIECVNETVEIGSKILQKL